MMMMMNFLSDTWPIFLTSYQIHIYTTRTMATPPIKWAQRKDSIFIEVAVADIEKDAKIVLTEVKAHSSP